MGTDSGGNGGVIINIASIAGMCLFKDVLIWFKCDNLPELQKSCGYAGITREEGLPYGRSVRKVLVHGRKLCEYKC